MISQRIRVKDGKRVERFRTLGCLIYITPVILAANVINTIPKLKPEIKLYNKYLFLGFDFTHSIKNVIVPNGNINYPLISMSKNTAKI